VLKKAHDALRAVEEKERTARIEARKGRRNHAYSALTANRTPVKTRKQRRAELEALVKAAIPTERRDW
jgi:hypothetical protein